MTLPSLPIELRPDVQSTDRHPMIDDLGRFAERHNLRGAVLISFTDESVCANSSGASALLAIAMEKLADDIFCAIQDGHLVAELDA